jgi:hypothetical protein
LHSEGGRDQDLDMIVSSLVVTLTSEPLARAAALARLAEDVRLTLGEPIGDRLPVVAETATSGLGAALCEELGARDGVVKVDVVAVDFSLESA